MFGHFDENAVICTAPTKTFNIAGLQIANIFVRNSALRHKLRLEIRRSGYSQLNAIGLAACKSAYLRGGEWLRQLKGYIAGNIEYVRGFLAERLPQIKLIEPEGTYLPWLDFRSLGLPQAELDALVTNKAKLWLDGGTMFGEEGEGFQRMNIACPRKTLEQAMRQLEEAVTHPQT
jgi:cystathionine beta-lyase